MAVLKLFFNLILGGCFYQRQREGVGCHQGQVFGIGETKTSDEAPQRAQVCV